MQSGANSRGVPALVNPSLRALVTLTDSEALPQPHPENWLAIEQLIRELQRVSFYAVNIGADKLADLYVLKRKAAWRHELATNPHAPRFLFRVPPRRNPAVQIPDQLHYPLQHAQARLRRIVRDMIRIKLDGDFQSRLVSGTPAAKLRVLTDMQYEGNIDFACCAYLANAEAFTWAVKQKFLSFIGNPGQLPVKRRKHPSAASPSLTK